MHDGWFVSPEHRTSHYAFEYAFVDSQDSSVRLVIMILFSKKDVAYAIDKDGLDGIRILADIHQDNDVIYSDKLGRLKFRKSGREGSFVLNITLEQLMKVPTTRAYSISPTRQARLSLDDLRLFYTA